MFLPMRGKFFHYDLLLFRDLAASQNPESLLCVALFRSDPLDKLSPALSREILAKRF